MRRTFFVLLSFVTLAANAASWRRYSEHGCIGGQDCRQNGRRITIALEDAPLLGIRFFADDNIGRRHNGKLNVKIDNHFIANYVDVHRGGRVHELTVDRIRGDRLVIETATDDEVEVRDIEVLYAPREYDRGRDYDRDRHEERWEREYAEEGGCIGGEQCGGHRARIRIPLRDQRVRSISFFAHDDVGNKFNGKLRVRIDDEIITDYLDIERHGRDYSFDGRGRRGRYLVIEPASDDEVVVKNIRIKYEGY